MGAANGGLLAGRGRATAGVIAALSRLAMAPFAAATVAQNR